MPDTVDNQKEYPQPNSQKAGTGFPIMRVVMIFSLAVGALREVAIGRYCGKKTGETSLLRALLDTVFQEKSCLLTAITQLTGCWLPHGRMTLTWSANHTTNAKLTSVGALNWVDSIKSSVTLGQCKDPIG